MDTVNYVSFIFFDHQEESRQVHDHMQSSMVQSVLNTGVDRDCVRNVIEKRLRDRGMEVAYTVLKNINVFRITF